MGKGGILCGYLNPKRLIQNLLYGRLRYNEGKSSMTTVNLDSLIPREDFAVEDRTSSAPRLDRIDIHHFESSAVYYILLFYNIFLSIKFDMCKKLCKFFAIMEFCTTLPSCAAFFSYMG